MAELNRRERIAAAYRGQQTLLEKVASSASQYGFVGNRVVKGAVVRVDLNGYSKWAAGRDISARVLLLDSFFSSLVPRLERAGGIFFRDEGDCIVGLFSPYFAQSAYSPAAVLGFAKSAVGARYGGDFNFTAKASIATADDVAIFQKRHELGTPDWSAEGQPFVTAARIEAAIPSDPVIFMRKDEFDRWYRPEHKLVGSGETYHWYYSDTEKLQAAGLGAGPGGWTEMVSFTHVPGGAVQP